MSEFWKELKDEIEQEVYQCEFCIKTQLQERGSYLCGNLWIPCAHVIATGQCEMFNRYKGDRRCHTLTDTN